VKNIDISQILAYLQGIAAIAGSLDPKIAPEAALASDLLLVIQAAVKAHEAITGQVLDLAALPKIDPIA